MVETSFAPRPILSTKARGGEERLKQARLQILFPKPKEKVKKYQALCPDSPVTSLNQDRPSESHDILGIIPYFAERTVRPNPWCVFGGEYFRIHVNMT